MKSPIGKLKVSWLKVGYILLAALAMYLLISQLSELRGSLGLLKKSRVDDDIAVLIFSLVSFLMASLTYYFLALRPIKYGRTVAIEFGINTLNRLLPAGLGAIGGNYVYLTKSRHTKAEAAAVVAGNTVIGVIANLLLLTALLLYFPARDTRLSKIHPHVVITVVVVLVVIVLLALTKASWRQYIIHNFKIVLRNLAKYSSRKLKLGYGLICQVGLTLANVLALNFSLRALNIHLGIGALMLAYSFAIWLGAVIPAPGGVGSVDAGLVAGLLAFKVDLASAVAGVLLFRLISFWLPFILGSMPLVWAYRRDYL